MEKQIVVIQMRLMSQRQWTQLMNVSLTEAMPANASHGSGSFAPLPVVN